MVTIAPCLSLPIMEPDELGLERTLSRLDEFSRLTLPVLTEGSGLAVGLGVLEGVPAGLVALAEGPLESSFIYFPST